MTLPTTLEPVPVTVNAPADPIATVPVSGLPFRFRFVTVSAWFSTTPWLLLIVKPDTVAGNSVSPDCAEAPS